MKWILLSLIVLTACNNSQDGYNQFLKDCDRVDIVVYNGGDTLFFDTRDSTGIHLLAAQVSGRQNNLSDTCPAQGMLRFRQDSTVLQEGTFAVTAGKGAGNCDYLAYARDGESYVQPLSERGKKLLQTVMLQAGKTSP